MHGYLNIERAADAACELARMTNAAPYRSPDGIDYLDGAIAMRGGSQAEKGHRDRRSGASSIRREPLVVVADARLDNRHDLAQTLGIGSPEHWSDAALILAAYDKWQTDCPRHLVGAFTFAIWNGREQTLFCARDPLGIRPFYFYLARDLFVFGEEAKVVLAHSAVPCELNETAAAAYLGLSFNDTMDPNRTFFRSVERLPGGCSLEITPDGVQRRRYWQPETAPEIRFRSDDEYVEAFIEVLREAVQCRVRDAESVGVLLSGGLDSSSVVALSARTDLKTVYAVPAVAECDEREYVEAVVARYATEHHELPMPGAFSRLLPLLVDADAPIRGPNYVLHHDSVQKACETSVPVLLDGNDGDNAVGYGLGLLYELAWRGKWGRFAAEVQERCRHTDESERGYAHMFGLSVLAEQLRRGNVLPVLAGLVQLRQRLGLRSKWLIRETLHHSSIRNVTVNPALSADFVQRNRINEHVVTKFTPYHTARDQHIAFLTNGYMYAMFNEIEQLPAQMGVDLRHPFADVRLVEFCLGLPSDQGYQAGWDRWLMRRAGQAFLPPSVAWRKKKTSFAAHIYHMTKTDDRNFIEQVVADSAYRNTPFIDFEALRMLYKRLLTDAQDADFRHFTRALTFTLWYHHCNLLHR